jgi:hypothetical protein
MTALTRRHVLVGAATTVAAAALPAIAVADVANGEVMLDPRHRFRDIVVGYIDRNGCEWFGRYDFVEMVRDLDEADLITHHELADFPEIA